MKKKRVIVISILVFVVFLFLLARKDTENKTEVTIEKNGILTELFELPIFAQTYSKGNWLSTQGLRASIELPNIADELPEIVWDEEIQVHVPEDVDLYYIIVFNENYQAIGWYSEIGQLRSFWDEASFGAYYVAIAVTWEGDFIPSMLGHESFGSEFVFKMVKEIGTEIESESEQGSETNSGVNHFNETAVDEMILGPGFAERYMSRADFLGFRVEELRLIRNGIYAKKGAIFQSEDLNIYFGSKTWYRGEVPVNEFPEESISDVERANLDLLKEMEAAADEYEEARNVVANLPEAPYLQYLDQYRETGMEADMSLAEDMGIYYVVPGVIKHPITFTEEQRLAMENGEEIAIVVDEVSGEERMLRKHPESAPGANVFLWYEKGLEPDADTEVINAWFDMESGVHTLWHFSDDTIMKIVYEGNLYILKGAGTGAHLNLELASADQREILIPDSNTEPWKADVYGNYLFHNGKGYFTAVYYLGD